MRRRLCQPARLQERKVKPHRAHDSTRLVMVILSRMFSWPGALGERQARYLPPLAPQGIPSPLSLQITASWQKSESPRHASRSQASRSAGSRCNPYWNSDSTCCQRSIIRCPGAAQFRRSHARAKFQSRITVFGATPKASAVSSTLNPPKKRISRTRLLRSSIFKRRSRARSTATICSTSHERESPQHQLECESRRHCVSRVACGARNPPTHAASPARPPRRNAPDSANPRRDGATAGQTPPARARTAAWYDSSPRARDASWPFDATQSESRVGAGPTLARHLPAN